MQGMLDNLSQPVAFATVPLGTPAELIDTSAPPRSAPRDTSLSSDTDMEEPMVSRWTRKLGMSRETRTSSPKAARATQPHPVDEDGEDELFVDGECRFPKCPR
jgi:hypothetical protein